MWRKCIYLMSLVLLVGCASDVATDYNKNINFNQYQSYQYWQHDALPVGLDMARIQSAVDQQLAQRGIVETDDNADLDVRIDIIEAKEQLSDGPTFGVGFGTGNFGISTRTPERIRERAYGKIAVSMIDRSTEKVVWKSISQRQLLETMSPETRNQFIIEQVQAMFDEFPVSLTAQ